MKNCIHDHILIDRAHIVLRQENDTHYRVIKSRIHVRRRLPHYKIGSYVALEAAFMLLNYPLNVVLIDNGYILQEANYFGEERPV